MPFTLEPTHSPELGARVLPGGVRFAVHSRHARSVLLALFREGAADPIEVLPLSCQGHVFKGFVPKLEPGALYGFYAEGPFDPRNGHRFNSSKLLLDPYASALHGPFRNEGGVLYGHVPGGEDADLTPDHRPNHAFMPKCMVTESRFDWQGVKPPDLSRDRLVIYETHLRGFTAHPSSGVAEPGTFRGLIEKIPHLKALGVNAVELLPVHAKFSEDFLTRRGLNNYWGYNTAGFFALEPSYGSRSRPGCEIDEFKLMVRELHREGIEVILDVVYNHTAEGSELGPTLSLRGLDNRSYYALTGSAEAPFRHCWNHTGCGNTLDFGSIASLRLVLDSLRYFTEEFHVDGFRFDLATIHGRRAGGPFDPDAAFFATAAQDPVLRRVKLIAEPWDLETYGLGRFPDGWMEWNGGFRDVARRFVRGESGLLPALRDKLEGSPETFALPGREPWAGINFVTCHDGFTLRDLVSYEQKHNQKNGEDNWDGSNDNNGWNCGIEGETDDPDVTELRRRQARNLLLLTILARGTPMLLGGDEFLRTQGGNNNAYGQDNPVSWHDWTLAGEAEGFLRFFREALVWRKKMEVPNAWASVPDRAWGRCWRFHDLAGRPLADDKTPDGRHAALLFARPVLEPALIKLDPEKEGPLFYLLLNGEDAGKVFHPPHLPPHWRWAMAADTSLASPQDIATVGGGFSLLLADRYDVSAHSTALLWAERCEVEDA